LPALNQGHHFIIYIKVQTSRVQYTHQVLAVSAFYEGLGDFFELPGRNEPFSEGYFFDAADLKPLPFFDDLHEIAGLHEGGKRTRIEPGRAPVEDAHL
jgi:hypothetical protein